jgi:IS5 family transposase
LLSSDHFSVDGSLIDALASMKSFRPKGERDSDRDPPDDTGNPTVNFHGEKRSNATHESTTDPEARLCRKGPGKESRLAYAAHALMENRNGLLVDLAVSQVDGYAERTQALELVRRQRDRGVRVKTLAGDKNYDVPVFVDTLREEGVTPHVAAKDQYSAINRRTTRHETYRISQRCRKRIEEIFGWMKTVGGFRRTRYRGTERTGLWGYFVGAAYNLVRMGRMLTYAA